MPQTLMRQQLNTYQEPMQRTQVYLPWDLLEQIKEKAQQESKSMAAVIRKLIRQALPKEKVRQKPDIFKLLEKIQFEGDENTPTDLAANHDKYLYG